MGEIGAMIARRPTFWRFQAAPSVTCEGPCVLPGLDDCDRPLDLGTGPAPRDSRLASASSQWYRGRARRADERQGVSLIMRGVGRSR